MANATYTKAQLRDLVVAYYSMVDPDGLNAGVDVNGIVQWCEYYGVEDMDARLQAKYGIGFDYSVLTKPKDQTISAMHRISMMPADMEKNRKNMELAQKLTKFYERKDPSKLGNIQNFVDWIQQNGYEEFNALIKEKYGEDLDTATQGNPEPPAAAAEPPKQMLQRQMSDNSAMKLTTKLERFYMKHEPEKVQHIKPIVDWALKVGEEELNSKLVQIYGEGLDDVTDEDLAQPAPPQELMSSAAASSSASAASQQQATLQRPSQATLPKPAAPARKEPPKKPEPPKFVQQAASTSSAGGPTWAKPRSDTIEKNPHDGPCSNYRLDMKGATFGVCVCGYNKAAHKAARPNSVKKNLFPPKPSGAAPSWQQQNKPSAPPPKINTSAPPMQQQSFPAATATSPTNAGNVNREPQPCSNYRLDMSGKSFGDCKCGWPKLDHGKGVIAPSSTFNGNTSPKAALSGNTSPKASFVTAAPSPPKPPVAPAAPKWTPTPAAAAPPAKPTPPQPPTPPKFMAHQEETRMSVAEEPENANWMDDDIPPPPPPDDDYDPWNDPPPPPPPIEETPEAQTLRTVIDMMSSTYIQETGESPDMETKQQWAGELYKSGGAKHSKLNEVAQATARMSINSKLAARSKALGKQHPKFS